MAGRFLLLTDNHVRQQLVEALTSRGWDVVRAIDVFPERTSDEVLFAHAAATGRVFVSTDEPAQEIPKRWLREGRPFQGMICWKQLHRTRMTESGFLRAFEDLADEPDPFAYPIRYIKPQADR